MKTLRAVDTLPAILVVALALLRAGPVEAVPLIVNGGFEAGFVGWTVADLEGGDGSFFLQSGTNSPVTGEPVPAPPEGLMAAMSDALGPGAHVLYQDFVVPAGVGAATLSFEVFLGNRAGVFFTPSPPTLMFDIPALNQQARVDIMRADADPFSVAPGDVLLNVLQTTMASQPTTAYIPISADLTALLAANPGRRLRLRFAETDNVFTFQLGVDRVALDVQSVPEPGTALLVTSGLISGIARFRRRRRR